MIICIRIRDTELSLRGGIEQLNVLMKFIVASKCNNEGPFIKNAV